MQGTELFIGIHYGQRGAAAKKKAKYIWHSGLQLLNIIAMIMIGSITSGTLDERHYCILSRSKKISMTIIGGVTLICVCFTLAQCVMMLRSRSAFTNMKEIRQLFKGMIVSMVLLNSCTIVVFLESALVPWEEWKNVYFTLLVFWNTSNTLWVIGYLLHVQQKSTKSATSHAGGASQVKSSYSQVPSNPHSPSVAKLNPL
jgi:magnesium-transporting ATPase (P-type)